MEEMALIKRLEKELGAFVLLGLVDAVCTARLAARGRRGFPGSPWVSSKTVNEYYTKQVSKRLCSV
jgi:hypothetical protein